MVDVSISIINTNNREQTLQCLRSLFANTHRVSLEVFVVDNACTDGSADAIAAEFPQVKLIRNAQKLGFSTNNNKALSQASGRYLCILNDDTIVQDGAFDTLVAFMDAHSEVGACGPKLLNSDGSNQPAFLHFTNPLEELVSIPLLFHWQPSRWDVSEVISTGWVGGACMLVRREAVDHVGLLDTEFDPLYAEERDWCYRIKKVGWQIYHVPAARVVHLGGQTTKHTSVAMAVRLYRHKLVFYRKHAGSVTTLQYRLLLLSLSCLRIATSCLALPFSLSRSSVRQRLATNLQIVRFCLTGG